MWDLGRVSRKGSRLGGVGVKGGGARIVLGFWVGLEGGATAPPRRLWACGIVVVKLAMELYDVEIDRAATVKV